MELAGIIVFSALLYIGFVFLVGTGYYHFTMKRELVKYGSIHSMDSSHRDGIVTSSVLAGIFWPVFISGYLIFRGIIYSVAYFIDFGIHYWNFIDNKYIEKVKTKITDKRD